MRSLRSGTWLEIRKQGAALGLTALALAGSPVALAQDVPLALRDSFPLGGDRAGLCQVQNRSGDVAIKGMFDRSWAIVCRDSALPVGYVFALRKDAGDPAQRLADRRRDRVECDGAAQSATPVVAGATEQVCKWRDGNLGYTVAQVDRGKTLYAVEGFAAYDSALGLALRSILEDRVVPGQVEVVTTSIEDPAAFARVQALTLEPDQALAEGYRRNNSGAYAEAAEFFETLQQRFADPADSDLDPEEFLLNLALQKSNLGQFTEADSLFAQARDLGSPNPVQQRLQRNFEAIHLLNQRRYAEAVERLRQPVDSIAGSADLLRQSGTIGEPISSRINGGDSLSGALGFVDDLRLTDEERAYIIDAQSVQLQGTAKRLMGDPDGARANFVQALREVISVRDGRVVSIIRLRAQIMVELAFLEEQLGNQAAAGQWMDDALTLLQLQYPETSIVNAVRARKAAFLVRQGRDQEALDLYRKVVASTLGQRNALTGFGNQLSPYFDLLVERMPSQPALASDYFDATQILVRPGVADTQAILARELSSGDSDAARLFRQSRNLSREIEKVRIRLAVLAANGASDTMPVMTSLTADLAALETAQQEALVRLSDYPQYLAAASPSLPLADLQAGLKPGEIYVQMAEVAGRIYMFEATADSALAYRAGLDAAALSDQVDAIRYTIAHEEEGQVVTMPFAAEESQAVYAGLFGPVAERVEAARHMVFEPAGAMLRLPPQILITRAEPAAAYVARLEDPEADPFDLTEMPWLGRNVRISTAVSARSFIESRRAPASKAQRQYLGLGENRPVFDMPGFVAPQPQPFGDPSCGWPLNQWNAPIAATELEFAKTMFGDKAELMTGEAFADDRLLERGDLSDFRILHFATHGLVTPPAAQCPARPALLTSFGGAQSDGLLSFQEIFDMRLDADMVILSACDTAARASVMATREAGLDSGGGTALDGLVRSFIGAGGRAVLASHWPVPDDYGATERLITGLFTGSAGESTIDVLAEAQTELMNDPLTSHPYYWAGFAVIGDGTRPLVTAASGNLAGGESGGTEGGR